MANETVRPPADDLKRRCAALGYKLFITGKGEQIVIEQREQDGPFEVVFIHRTDEDDELEEWLAGRERTSDARPAARTELVHIIDGLHDQLRYATAAMLMLCESTEIEEYQRDAGGAILDRLWTSRRPVDQLGEWRKTVPALAPSEGGAI